MTTVIEITIRTDEGGQRYRLVPEGPVAPEALAPWREGDEELAVRYLRKLSDVGLAFIEHVVGHEERLGTAELAEALGLGAHEFAGALSWPGRHAYALGRLLPWTWDELTVGMDDEVRAVFRRALELLRSQTS